MKKYILGINDFTDPSIAIIKNGSILFYIEEERLNRIKHSHNVFPIKSIIEAFNYLNISFKDNFKSLELVFLQKYSTTLLLTINSFKLELLILLNSSEKSLNSKVFR